MFMFNIILKLITCWEINQVPNAKLIFWSIQYKKGLKQKKERHYRILHIHVDFLKQICHKKEYR